MRIEVWYITDPKWLIYNPIIKNAKLDKKVILKLIQNTDEFIAMELLEHLELLEYLELINLTIVNRKIRK